MLTRFLKMLECAVLAGLLICATPLADTAQAQFQTPAHSIPIGRGGSGPGFRSVGPCSAAHVPFLSGATTSDDPVCEDSSTPMYVPGKTQWDFSETNGSIFSSIWVQGIQYDNNAFHANINEPFLHNYRPEFADGANTFLGTLAGNFTMNFTERLANPSASPPFAVPIQTAYNTGIGTQALRALTSGYNNTGIGVNAMRFMTVGFQNTAVGRDVMEHALDGADNVAMGHSALHGGATCSPCVDVGVGNTSIGKLTLYNNTANYNTSLGFSAGFNNTTGTANVRLGANAGYSGTTSSHLVLAGYQAGYDLTTAANDNTFIGYNSGRGITTGTGNTIIGANLTGLSSTLTNHVIIADGAAAKKFWADDSGNVALNGGQPDSGINLKLYGGASGNPVMRLVASTQGSTTRYHTTEAATAGYSVGLNRPGDSAGTALVLASETAGVWTTRLTLTNTGALSGPVSYNNIVLTDPGSTATFTLAAGKTFTVSNTLTFSGTDAKALVLTSGLTVGGTNDGTIAFGAASKTVTFGNSLTFAGTDSTTMTFPSSSTTLAGLGVANTFTQTNQFNGLVTLANGAAANPSLAFTNDTNLDSGFYRIAENRVGLALGGTLKVDFQTGGLFLSNIIETITSSSATAFNVGRQGSTNPAFQVDAATATSVTGVRVTAGATTTGVDLAAIGDTTDVSLRINAKGAGTISLTANPFFTSINTDATKTDATLCRDTTSGEVYTGTGTAGICRGTSSVRFKRDVVDVTEGLNTLVALRPVNFFYKDGYGLNTANEQYGFLAEDVAKVIPRIVGFDNDNQPRSVDLLGMVPIIVSSIKELKAANDNLEARVQALEAK